MSLVGGDKDGATRIGQNKTKVVIKMPLYYSYYQLSDIVLQSQHSNSIKRDDMNLAISLSIVHKLIALYPPFSVRQQPEEMVWVVERRRREDVHSSATNDTPRYIINHKYPRTGTLLSINKY